MKLEKIASEERKHKLIEQQHLARMQLVAKEHNHKKLAHLKVIV